MASTLTPVSGRLADQCPARRAARPVGAGGRSTVNVGDLERWLSAAGGTALSLYGLTHRSLGGLAVAVAGGGLLYRGLTGHCPAYERLGLSTAGRRGPATGVPAGRGEKVVESVTLNRPAGDVYRYWRDLENLSKVMKHLESVRVTDDRRSHWVARGPLGFRAEWDAEVINDRPGELIAWRSLPGSQVDTAGSVHFSPAPGGRGTEVRVELKYNPPGGKGGALIAKLFGEAPEWTLREDLRRFKQQMEAGEVPTTEGQPRGTCR